MKKVYIENSSNQYIVLFRALGYDVVDDFNKANIVCFTGGEDVSPELYGHKKHHSTHNNHYRDAKEQRLFMECILRGKGLVGICRGAQFLHVMCGGTLFQDVIGHAGKEHLIEDYVTGEIIPVSSTHHQAMRIIGPIVGTPIAYECDTSTAYYWNHKIEDFTKREGVPIPEVAIHKVENSKILCVQFHPEYAPESPMGWYFGRLLNRYLFN
jgi:gamma-glutamyl-gamma-aminobutyrate hydrolase PuuD